MVGNYKRHSTRQSWEIQNMEQAIKSIEKKEMGWYLASKTFNVPQATLRRRVLGRNKDVTGAEKGLGRYRTTFPLALENDLIQHIKNLESSLFGLSVDDVRRLAYQLAEINRIDHRFNKEEKMAG